jgi:hypothetical protein
MKEISQPFGRGWFNWLIINGSGIHGKENKKKFSESLANISS